jgi:hypothetical protein
MFDPGLSSRKLLGCRRPDFLTRASHPDAGVTSHSPSYQNRGRDCTGVTTVSCALRRSAKRCRSFPRGARYRRLEHPPFLRNRDTLSNDRLAHVLIGEPAATRIRSGKAFGQAYATGTLAAVGAAKQRSSCGQQRRVRPVTNVRLGQGRPSRTCPPRVRLPPDSRNVAAPQRIPAGARKRLMHRSKRGRPITADTFAMRDQIRWSDMS